MLRLGRPIIRAMPGFDGYGYHNRMSDSKHPGGNDAPHLPKRWEKVLYVLLSPLIMAWTGWNFWRLFETGRMYVADGTGVTDTGSGLQFWVQLGLYVVLFFAAAVVMLVFFRWLFRRRTPSP
jgi:hypothetical protein